LFLVVVPEPSFSQLGRPSAPFGLSTFSASFHRRGQQPGNRTREVGDGTTTGIDPIRPALIRSVRRDGCAGLNPGQGTNQ
jgi:hypothetical protein